MSSRAGPRTELGIRTTADPDSEKEEAEGSEAGDWVRPVWRSRAPALLVIALSTSVAAAAWAQSADDAGDAPFPTEEVVEVDQEGAVPGEDEKKEHVGIEEMVVSAERRERSIQEVPVSVSSFSGSDLTKQGLTDFNTLQYNVPGLFSGGGLTRVTLRGVGSEIVGPGVDPGFAVHINNVFSAREATGLVDYYDIQRVDVLRGPQGTLWGRNSTGGAVNIITRRPEQDFDATADFEYAYFKSGNAGLRIRGMLNMPLVEDRLALRVALLTNFNDGTLEIDGPYNQQRLNDAGVSTLRASLRWLASDEVTVDFIGSWFRNKGAGPGIKFDGPYETPERTASIGPPLPGGLPRTIPTWPGAGPGENYAGDPSCADNGSPCTYQPLGAAWPNPTDPYKGTANEPQRSEAETWTATLLIEWARDNFRFDSITGYQSTAFFIHRDNDTSSLPFSTLDLSDRSMQISQEFLVNSTWDFPVDYTVGANYQFDRSPRTEVRVPNHENTRISPEWMLFPALGAPIDISLVDGCPVPAGLTGPYDPSCPPTKPLGATRLDVVNVIAEVDNHVFGLFGNVTWNILDELAVSAGGRFSYTKRSWNDTSQSQTYTLQVAPRRGLQVLQVGLQQEADWPVGTWKVSADYELTDDNMFWASVGTGARAGGFNFSQEQDFGQEEILAVEAGSKNMFFDNRLVLNLTGFWYDWTNPQINTTENALPLTTNGPDATSYGIELEWQALPIDELAINGSFGWLEASFVDNFFSLDNSVQDLTEPLAPDRPLIVNLNGNRMPRSPRFTASFGIQYTHEMGKWGSIVPRVDFYYRDWIIFRQFDNPKDIADRYTRTDARLSWFSESGQFWAELFARNLENNAVKTNQEILSSINRAHYFDAPINGGVRFGYFFR